MTESTRPQGIFAKSGTRKRVRWFSALVAFGLVMTTGVVVADVILTYTLSNSIGSVGSSPFAWEEGANYQTAADLSLVSGQTCQGVSATPSATCYQLGTTVSAIADTATTMINIYAFTWTAAGAASGFGWNIGPGQLAFTSGATVLGAHDCAYLVVSNALLGEDDIAFNPGTCAITVTPSAANADTACGGAAVTAGAAVYDLVSGNSVSGSYACDTTGNAAGPALEISYVLYTPSGATGTAATMSINAVEG